MWGVGGAAELGSPSVSGMFLAFQSRGHADQVPSDKKVRKLGVEAKDGGLFNFCVGNLM